ncbi:LytTR family transcriptional regulator DNA-binding domain-containing protein [Bacteroidales bacterium OttesenSCG-928-J19]|nr:LytTR family transcriptional regulator DNA-binding domain-containing protein [Bacteroidales bacterium OttesenSCG-928-J19]
MNNPFFRNKFTCLGYLGVWVVYLTILTFLFRPAENIFVLCTSQAVILLLLWYPIRYYQNTFKTTLFLLFHTALLVLFLALSFGLYYGIGKDIQNYPILILLSVFVYTVGSLIYYIYSLGTEFKTQAKEVESLQKESQEAVEKLSRISVKKNKEIGLIPVGEIHYIEANGDYVLIHSTQGRFLKDKTMKYWEANLPDIFVRTHRSFIVNINHIARLELYEKDSYRIRMKESNAEIKVSQSGYKLLKQQMQI